MKKLNTPLSCLVVLAYVVLWIAVIILCGCAKPAQHGTKLVVIDFFYADWCGSCLKQQKLLPSLEAYAAKCGYVIRIHQHDVDTKDGWRRFEKAGRKTIPVFAYHVRNGTSTFSGICHTVREFKAILQ